MRGEWEVEALALEVVLTCTEMPSPCQVAGREEPRRRPHLPGRMLRKAAERGGDEGLTLLGSATAVGALGLFCPRRRGWELNPGPSETERARAARERAQRMLSVCGARGAHLCFLWGAYAGSSERRGYPTTQKGRRG